MQMEQISSDVNGEITFSLNHARWTGNGTKPDAGNQHETGHWFNWKRVDDISALKAL